MQVAHGEAERVAFALGLVADRVEVAGLRVLDLACRTGAFSIAFADAGAHVVGVEGRSDNLALTPPSTATYELGDVRDLSVEQYGTFDVTLCLGILYHLEPADAVRLLTVMREVTTRFAVVDTHVGVDAAAVVVDGREYRGNWWSENTDHPWSAIGNQQSWWFTPESLDDAIRAAGWATIDHAPGPSWPGETENRRWLVIS